ncbi:MAG TPA: hypothetical protein VNX01_07680 [Bacteroidia bacterium]|jgi:hypothetical protein|nr:hypothetical protein [Bacteroidia bacterium]
MRNFFIIGHNPNTVADAMRYLQTGANALEPDVHFVNGDFYMGEGTTSTDLSLTMYLKGLTQQLVINPIYIPSLIMFDTKNSDGNIASMFECIQTNFSSQFNNTVIMITRSHATEDEHIFFSPMAGKLTANEGIGVDEHTNPKEADLFFKSLKVKNYTYADGISIPVLSEIFWERIKNAVALRDTGSSFKMVYAWTLDHPMDIHSFLKLNPDGMITDSPAALKEILKSYPDQYQLALLGYNPFA